MWFTSMAVSLPAGIVYCLSRKDCETMSAKLNEVRSSKARPPPPLPTHAFGFFYVDCRVWMAMCNSACSCLAAVCPRTTTLVSSRRR